MLKKLFLMLLISPILAFSIFYFWASSSNYAENDYSKLIENQYPKSTNEDSVYSIVSYNIGYLSGMTNNQPVPKTKSLFDDNLKTVCAEFEKINADIICFQEIDYGSKRSFYVDQQEELQKLGYSYIFQAVNWDKKYIPFPGYWPSMHHGTVYSGQSIMSKYPVFSTERIILDRVESHPFYRDAFYLERLAQVTKVELGEDTIMVINVHLEAFDKETRMKHAQFVANLYRKYENTLPVLLLGDFNSDREWENAAIKTIMDIPGIASSTIDNLDKEKTFTSDEPTKRIDYIFYNTEFIEMQSSEILSSFGQASDHLPVLMEFRLKQPD